MIRQTRSRRMYDERELTVEAIARVLEVSRTNVYRALQADPPAAAQPAVVEPAGRRRRRAPAH